MAAETMISQQEFTYLYNRRYPAKSIFAILGEPTTSNYAHKKMMKLRRKFGLPTRHNYPNMSQSEHVRFKTYPQSVHIVLNKNHTK
jgi:hypothetical protein